MKIAVSATGNNLNSELNPRFGRCEYFIIVETDDMSFDAYENENNELSSGAGIQSASFVASKGAGVVLTGNCGPKATQTFSAAGIKVLTGFSGTVKNAVEQFKTNKNEPQADVSGSESYAPDRKRNGYGRRHGNGGVEDAWEAKDEEWEWEAAAERWAREWACLHIQGQRKRI